MTASDMVLWPTGLRFCGRHIPASIGRGGISATKREGDGATPAGVHRIAGLLYRPDRIGQKRMPRWAEPIRPFDIWSDDPGDPSYNLKGRGPVRYSHERLYRADPLYDIVLLTDWNWPDAIPGRGSAIFLHQWRRPGYPTEGCVAVAREALLWMLPRIRPETRLIVPG